MQFACLAVAALHVAGTFAATCPTNGNNCARAVTGTFMGQQTSRRNDCSAFLSCTVYPATSTITTTSTSTPSAVTIVDSTMTVTVTSPVANSGRRLRRREDKDAAQVQVNIMKEREVPIPVEVERRQAPSAVTSCPTAVPTYASACTSGGSSSAYASACSCAGVSRAYTTAATPSATSTSTVTAAAPTTHITATSTTTVATPAPTPPSLFYVRVGPSHTDPNDDRYFSVVPNSDGTYDYLADTATSVSNANTFSLSNQFAPGQLVEIGGGGVISFIHYASDQNVSPLYVGASPNDAASTLKGSLGSYDAAQGGFPLTFTLAMGRVLSQDSNSDVVVDQNAGATALPTLYAIGA